MTVHVYSLTTDFVVGNGIRIPLFQTTIANSSIVPNLLSTGVEGDAVTTTFDVALSGPEVTTLDGIVAAHDGTPLDEEPGDIESHTIASHDTTATGAELNELTDGSTTTLHSHDDGSGDEVIVKSVGDLPAPSAGSITLADNTRYLIRGSIAIGTDELVLGINSSLLGRSSRYDGIVYTGTGTMITAASTAVEVLIEGLKLTASSGTVFDINGVADFELRNARLDAGTIGDIDTTANAEFGDVTMSGFDTGPSFSGTGGQLTMRDVRMTQTTGAGSNRVIDLGSATFDSVRLHLVRAITATGGVSLGGLASGGNVNTGGFATVNDSDFGGSGSALATVTEDDLQWWFDRTIGVVNSEVVGHLQQNSSSANTSIGGGGSGDKLNMTATLDLGRRMSEPSANRLRYDDLQTRQAWATMQLLSSGNEEVERTDYGIAVNGTIVVRINDMDAIEFRDAISMTFPLPTPLSTGDFVEMFGFRSGSNRTFTIRGASLVVRAR